jgi:hypothetical protein
MSVKLRPHPRAYVVSGAGTEEVNGTYEIDQDLLTTCNRQLRRWPGIDIRYVKKKSHVQEEDDSNSFEEICLKLCYGRWMLKKVQHQDHAEDVMTRLYANDDDPKYELHRPREENWSRYQYQGQAALPSPTLQHVGFVLVQGMDGNTQTPEHKLAKWLIENNFPGLVANDADVQSPEARAALKSILEAIDDVSKLISDQVSFGSNVGYSYSAQDAEHDLALVESIIKSLTKDESALEIVDKDLIAKSLSHLQDLRKKINIVFPSSKEEVSATDKDESIVFESGRKRRLVDAL